MYRLLIILILLVVLALLVRRAVIQWRKTVRRGHPLDAADQLVQDPVCRMYVTKASAISERVRGETYYFCSSECAKAYRRQVTG